MWGIVLVVAAVITGMECAAQGEDVTPQYINCANLFYGKIDTRLKEDQSALNGNFKMVISKLNLGQKDVKTLKDKVEALDAKIEAALARGTGGGGGGQVDMSALEASIGAKLDALTQSLEGQVRAVVDALLVTHVDVVKQHVRDAVSTLGTQSKLTEVLAEVRTVKDDVARVNNETEATLNEVKKCQQENAAGAIGGVTTKIDELKEEMDELEEGLGLGLGAVMEALVEVYNNTTPPPPPTTPSYETGEITPCDDSTFRGANSINVCQSAVRFNKCQQRAVAYHCCHTCTSEGKLPEMGPWRYVNQTREVSTLDVIRFFAL